MITWVCKTYHTVYMVPVASVLLCMLAVGKNYWPDSCQNSFETPCKLGKLCKFPGPLCIETLSAAYS